MKKFTSFLILPFFLLFFLISLINPVHAVEFYGKNFAEEFTSDQTSFKLRGKGLKTFLFMKVFVAGFYLGEGAFTADPLEDIPKKLEVAYFRAIPAHKLAAETRRRIQINLSKADFERIAERVDVMDGYFVDIQPGDRYILMYIPGIGTKFIYNRELIGIIEGSDFARGLFSVWFGLRPIDPHLRDQLLNRTETEDGQSQKKFRP